MFTYAGLKESTFAACGQLSTDGKFFGMVSKQGTIVKMPPQSQLFIAITRITAMAPISLLKPFLSY